MILGTPAAIHIVAAGNCRVGPAPPVLTTVDQLHLVY
jgi:hypothetical protein